MPRKKKLLWQIYPSYILITLLALLAVTWYASRSLRQFYFKQTAADLGSRAHLIENQLRKQLPSTKTDTLDLLCKQLGKSSSTRITVILPSGKVIGDSEEASARMDNHADRPEVISALAGNIGTAVRFSHTLQKNMMYVAIPIKSSGEFIGVLRTSIPVTSIDMALEDIHIKIVMGGVLIAVLVAMISLIISRRLSYPLEEMKQGAERFADGDLKHKLAVPNSQEMGALAESMNKMAAQLDERIKTIVEQRNEQEAVFSSMIEGVLAVDAKERLIMLNQAAAKQLGISLTESQGKSIQEVMRNTELQRIITQTLSGDTPVESELVLYSNGGERFLQANGTSLKDAQGQNIGAVLVLNDVTRIRRLENIRRDFVANVSHELKTPITGIKLSVDTILEGAVDNHEETIKFLQIISRQADRLNAIIEDLLTLSRIEQEAERAEITLGRHRIKDVLGAAAQTCEVKAKDKKINIELNCQGDIKAKINPPLLEQAVINLVDNAIKYSEPESMIQVMGAQTDTEVTIQVKDHGCGIAEEHLPRLFERFYLVDKARSRKLGGTGLGLAIVKHIAQAHKGKVSVESTPGEGSTFFIYLPLA